MSNDSKRIGILWTGGLDSTFMLCMIARKAGYSIEPVYVSNPKRKSRQCEIRAMKQILELLRKDKNVKSKICDIKIIQAPKNTDTEKEKSYLALNDFMRSKNKYLGYQYLYLASLPKEVYPLCLGLEKCPKSDDGNASYLITYNATLKKKDDFLCIDREKTSSDINMIFGNMIFPIIEITEKEMLAKMHAWGYSEILNNIWFCHSPIHGEACGICPPCRCKIKDQTDVKIPQKALMRYAKWYKIKDKNPKLANKLAEIHLALFSHPKN